MKICFLVGSIGISGGTYVIFQHAYYLQQAGHTVTLAVQEPFTAEMLGWHDKADLLECVPFLLAQHHHFDVVIATWWKTALVLHNFIADRYAYFVQSIESRFYPESHQALRKLVESTYHLPVNFITEASWIREWLHNETGHDCTLVRNGIRKDIFCEEGEVVAPRQSGHIRILVEGPFGVPFKNTALAVNLAKRAGANELWVMTSTPVKRLPGVDRVFSKVPTIEVASIYRSCDLIIKLSTVEGMFGPPLEMFHCGGTALVFNVSGHDEYIRDGNNALVIPKGDITAVVSYLSDLLKNEQKLSSLCKEAILTAHNWPDWKQSSEEFTQWLESLPLSTSDTKKVIAQHNLASNINYNSNSNSNWQSFSVMIKNILKKYLPASLIAKLQGIQAVIEILRIKNHVC